MFKRWKLAVVAASLLIGGVAVAKPADHVAGGKRPAMLSKFDANKDGKLDATERAAMQKEKFAKLDTNHDGVLSFDEAKPLFKHHGNGRGAQKRNHAGKKRP